MPPEPFDGLSARLADDGRFGSVAGDFDADVVLDVADAAALLSFEAGRLAAVRPQFDFSSFDFAVRIDAETWDHYREADPPPFHQDLRSVWINHGCRIEGNQELALRHWPAVRRVTRVLAEGWSDD